MIAEQERAPRPIIGNNGPTQNSHNLWEQQQSFTIHTTFHLFLDIFIVNETDLIRTNLLFTIFVKCDKVWTGLQEALVAFK